MIDNKTDASHALPYLVLPTSCLYSQPVEFVSRNLFLSNVFIRYWGPMSTLNRWYFITMLLLNNESGSEREVCAVLWICVICKDVLSWIIAILPNWDQNDAVESTKNLNVCRYMQGEKKLCWTTWLVEAIANEFWHWFG